MKIICLKNLNVPVNSGADVIKNKIAKIIKVNVSDFNFSILKKSIDARKKNEIKHVYNVRIDFIKPVKYDKKCVEIVEIAEYSIQKSKKQAEVAIVGAGPCGLFSALALIESGIKPVIFERGKKIEDRTKDVNSFFTTAKLNVESNVQFGEGGAGAFSDGKLNTGIKNERSSYVLKKFVECGAPDCILYDAHPHIGTDNLKIVVKNIREKIISHGGEFVFEAKVTDFVCNNGKIASIIYEKDGKKFERTFKHVVLAVGHSARDVFTLLKNKTILEAKPFSVGVRIEHLREDINKAQYGMEIGISAEYKLSKMLDNGRGVYTFCMCPGGVVVPSSSEEFGVVTNGMSYFKRDEINSNSALLVSVNPSDFGSSDVLAGVDFQRRLERLAYDFGGKNYKAPYQLVGDLFANKTSNGFGKVKPSYAIGVKGANFNEILPNYVVDGLKEGIKAFDNRLKGFAKDDSVLTGIETRSSSPVKIVRGETGESLHIKGLYPAGEGAGYAGGITSSAVDGVYIAEKIIEKINA